MFSGKSVKHTLVKASKDYEDEESRPRSLELSLIAFALMSTAFSLGSISPHHDDYFRNIFLLSLLNSTLDSRVRLDLLRLVCNLHNVM